MTLRFNDSVDFSRYEDGIRQLLNTYVHAEDAKTLIEPLDITNKEKMQEQLARLGSDEAKAEAIQTRQVEVLESQRYVDPIRYMTFMERINKTLQDYQEKRNGEKYLSAMEKWLRITGLAAARWNTRKTSWMMVMQNRFTVQCVPESKNLWTGRR